MERALCDMSTPHDGWRANPSLTLEDIANNAIANAKRTSTRVLQLNYLRTNAEPPLNKASNEVMSRFVLLINHVNVLSDEDFVRHVTLLLQLNHKSYFEVTVWVDDILDELGVVDERSPLRDEVEKLLLNLPEIRSNPAEAIRRIKRLFGRAPFPGGKDAPLAQAWEDFTKKLRDEHPLYQKIVYKEGRSPYTTGHMQSLNTL